MMKMDRLIDAIMYLTALNKLTVFYVVIHIKHSLNFFLEFPIVDSHVHTSSTDPTYDD